MKRPFFIISTGKWTRKYLIFFMVLFVFTIEIVSVAKDGMGPRPQLPPNNFVVEQNQVFLQWHRGNIDKPIRLQIALEKKFNEPVFDQEVNAITQAYSDNLIKGQRYYWRLIQDDKPSRVQRFKVSPQNANL